jgi:hypothetical protein
MDLTITAANAMIKANVAHYLTPTAIKFILHTHQNSPNSNQLLARHSVIGPN